MPMTPDDRLVFDDFIDQLGKQLEQEAESKRRAEEEKERQERIAEREEFRSALTNGLTEAWVNLLALEFSTDEASAKFSDGELDFEYFTTRSPDVVAMRNARLGLTKNIRFSVLPRETLLFVREARKKLQKELEREKAHAAHEAQKQVEYEAALPIDAEIRLKIAARHDEELAKFAFDAYPIVLYEMSYNDEQNQPSTLWTLNDHLTDDGYIVGYDPFGERHELRQVLALPQIRWEKFVFNSLDDLPYNLKEEGYRATLDGVDSRFFSAGNRNLYVYEEGSSIEVNNWDIQRPVAWLRAAAQTITDARRDAKGTDVPIVIGSTWDTAEQRLQYLLAALEPLKGQGEPPESLIQNIVQIAEQFKAH